MLFAGNKLKSCSSSQVFSAELRRQPGNKQLLYSQMRSVTQLGTIGKRQASWKRICFVAQPWRHEANWMKKAWDETGFPDQTIACAQKGVVKGWGCLLPRFSIDHHLRMCAVQCLCLLLPAGLISIHPSTYVLILDFAQYHCVSLCVVSCAWVFIMNPCGGVIVLLPVSGGQGKFFWSWVSLSAFLWLFTEVFRLAWQILSPLELSWRPWLDFIWLESKGWFVKL